MDESFLSRRFMVAACRAAPFLTQSLADHIQHKVERGSGFAIADVIKWSIPIDVWTSPNLHLPPRCIDDFLSSMQQILSRDASQLIRSRAHAFDQFAGTHGLADKLIALRPASEAIFDVIEGIAHWAEDAAAEAVPFRPTQPNIITSTSAQESAEHGSEQEHPSAEGSSGMVFRSTTGEPLANAEPCPIIQLQLEGSTILEAWNGNPTTRAMEQLANKHERDADPTHFSFRALPVYHGADATVAIRYLRSHEIRHGILYGSVAENQVAPHHLSLPILWTGFSPLRCFLWSAFKSEVLQPVPNPTVQFNLERPWKCDDHEHVGVLLFKFQPRLPSAPGHASYVIPPGREQEWTTLIRTHPGGNPESLWRHFALIHRNVQTTWPQTIHSREHGAQMSMLLPYIKQFWRTVWFGTGVTALQASHQETYSISFTQTRPEAPPTDKNTKAKKH